MESSEYSMSSLDRTRRLSGKMALMNRFNGAPRLMIVSDLDHTMVDHDDPENLSLLRFNALWESSHRHDSLLVFSTARSPTLYKQLKEEEKPLLTPEITVMSVGTEIAYGSSMVPDDGWAESLNQKWDKNIVLEEASKFSELTLQSKTEQRPHKVSFYVDKSNAQEVTKLLSARLRERGLDVKIICSGWINLDILPQGAGKGQALAYLLNKFKAEGKSPIDTLVSGDSGNDAELFSIPNVHGVMVSNAQEELLQWYAENANDNPKIFHSTETCAAGIIQAIGHFGLGPRTSPRDVMNSLDSSPKYFNPSLEVVKFNLSYEKLRRGDVENLDLFIKTMKANCDPNSAFIHPSGTERSLRESIGALTKAFGDKQSYCAWVDRVFSTQISSDTWLVKYYKVELCVHSLKPRPFDCCTEGMARRSRICSAILTAKEAAWLHLHETWLDNPLAMDDGSWPL